MAAVFVAAMREWKRSFENGGRSVASLSQRIDKVLDVTIQREVERLELKLLVLSTIASAAPFIGLFGTVWGIMHSFTAIAVSKNSSLAVVAPGIAEALFATAIGLFAAIPALMAYNKLQAEVGQGPEPARSLRRRVLRDPVAADRRAAGGLRIELSMGMSRSIGCQVGRHGAVGAAVGMRAIAEINMTPFIDVMLVLLIIFMVAAPLIATGVPIDLPQTGAKPINVDQKPITVAIDAKGQIFLQDQATLEPDLVGKLQVLTGRATSSGSMSAATAWSITAASRR